MDGAHREIVLRQVPAGRGARSLGPEFEVVRTLRAAGIPVPEPLWIEPGANSLGGAFFVTAECRAKTSATWGATGVSNEIGAQFFDMWSHVWRHIGCLWLSQNFATTGRYASAAAAYVHGPRFLQQAVHSAFTAQA
ncbi:phosphotransferase [Spirillospora sp. CA-255316]